MNEQIKGLEDKMKKGERAEKFHLDLDHLTTGERRHLYELMYAHGPGNGKMMFLPIDQGLEHGPRDFFVNPPAASLEFQLSLAAEANYSGVACHIGLAQRHMKKWAGKVPLVLKLNGKTAILPEETPFSPLDAGVEEAVALGADAVGYTLYVGSPMEADDVAQFTQVRQEAKEFGLPVIMWAYPRGPFVDTRGGGRDSLAMVDYAARVANELGATICKINLPAAPKGGSYDAQGPFKGYNAFTGLSETDALKMAVQSAGRTGVLVSGGSKLSDQELVDKTRVCLEAGVDGIIFGRNMWQRKYDDALKMSRSIHEMMRNFGGK
jgi:class I fructose-bisphosphate aldolase